MSWRDQVLATTREVRRIYSAATHRRFCVKIVRADLDVVLVVTDAKGVSDEEVAAGKSAPEVLRGSALDVLYEITRGSNPFQLSREELDALDLALRDARDEIKLRQEQTARTR